MATTPAFLPGKFPWTEEPGGSMGLQRVGYDRATLHKHIFHKKHSTSCDKNRVRRPMADAE